MSTDHSLVAFTFNEANDFNPPNDSEVPVYDSGIWDIQINTDDLEPGIIAKPEQFDPLAEVGTVKDEMKVELFGAHNDLGPPDWLFQQSQEWMSTVLTTDIASSEFDIRLNDDVYTIANRESATNIFPVFALKAKLSVVNQVIVWSSQTPSSRRSNICLEGRLRSFRSTCIFRFRSDSTKLEDDFIGC
jgi:hypothetical protein